MNKQFKFTASETNNNKLNESNGTYVFGWDKYNGNWHTKGGSDAVVRLYGRSQRSWKQRAMELAKQRKWKAYSIGRLTVHDPDEKYSQSIVPMTIVDNTMEEARTMSIEVYDYDELEGSAKEKATKYITDKLIEENISWVGRFINDRLGSEYDITSDADYSVNNAGYNAHVTGIGFASNDLLDSNYIKEELDKVLPDNLKTQLKVLQDEYNIKFVTELAVEKPHWYWVTYKSDKLSDDLMLVAADIESYVADIYSDICDKLKSVSELIHDIGEGDIEEFATRMQLGFNKNGVVVSDVVNGDKYFDGKTNMMKEANDKVTIITPAEYRDLTKGFENPNNSINISMVNYNNYDVVRKAGVTWASLGTVSVAAAKAFIKQLATAIDKAEDFNSKNYKVDWSSDKKVNESTGVKDYTHDFIAMKLDDGKFTDRAELKWYEEKAYNGFLRGDMTREEYNDILDRITKIKKSLSSYKEGKKPTAVKGFRFLEAEQTQRSNTMKTY